MCIRDSIDAEHAFDAVYAKKLGIDVENLIISQPDNGEQALEIADNLIRSGAVSYTHLDVYKRQIFYFLNFDEITEK